MKKFAIAGIAALSIAASTAVYAQHHHWGFGHMRMNPEDRAAFLDARVAAVRAGLKLNADQEKLWPPVEAAVRDFAKLRIDHLRERADNMATSAAALKKIADAADPLYKTLDDGQKRRLAVLTHMGHRFGAEGWRQHRFERGMDRGFERDRGGDRGFDRDRYDGEMERGGPERL